MGVTLLTHAAKGIYTPIGALSGAKSVMCRNDAQSGGKVLRYTLVKVYGLIPCAELLNVFKFERTFGPNY
jgi:hypothetical protein